MCHALATVPIPLTQGCAVHDVTAVYGHDVTTQAPPTHTEGRGLHPLLARSARPPPSWNTAAPAPPPFYRWPLALPRHRRAVLPLKGKATSQPSPRHHCLPSPPAASPQRAQSSLPQSSPYLGPLPTELSPQYCSVKPTPQTSPRPDCATHPPARCLYGPWGPAPAFGSLRCALLSSRRAPPLSCVGPRAARRGGAEGSAPRAGALRLRRAGRRAAAKPGLEPPERGRAWHISVTPAWRRVKVLYRSLLLCSGV